MNNFIYIKIFVFIFLLFGISCKIPQPVTHPDIRLASDSIVAKELTDSISTGQVPRQLFFTDTVLQNLINEAVNKNFELLIANQHVRIAEIFLYVNGALRQPTLEATLNGQVDRFGFYTMNGIGNFDMNKSPNVTPQMRVPDPVPDVMIGLRSRWEIDIWGRLKDLRNSALENSMATRQDRQWLVTQLVAQVSILYYEWMALHYEQQVLDRNIQLQERALEIVQALKSGGRATELAVQQFQAQVYRTTSLRYQLGRQMIETESHIRFLCGDFPGSLKAETTIMQQQLPPVLQQGIPSALLEQRPDIAGALHRLSAAYAQTEAARKAFLPSFTISSYIGFQGFRLPSFFNIESLTAGLAGNVAAPLLQRRQIRGQYAVSEAEHQIAWLFYQQNVRQAVMEVYNALKGIENLQSEYNTKESELKVLRLAVGTANDLYINGYANYLEVITAQQSLLEADLELVQLKKNQMQYIIQLYRSTGGGWN
jgi:NodT family efflux transporter outer membrane factor (OMF) lipoprotein